MIEMDPETVPREMKKEGTDWVTMYNPKVRRTLDVELVHTLQHDRCVAASPLPTREKWIDSGPQRGLLRSLLPRRQDSRHGL